MSSPQQTQAPAQPNANVTSTGWIGAGTPQATTSWCFAAAEHLVHRAFGPPPSQDEIAHNCMLARGEIGDSKGNVPAYCEGLQVLASSFGLGDLSWATVGAYVTSDQTLNNLLRHEKGQPQLTGRTFTRTDAPNAARIVRTLDAGGLVIIGDQIHWKVVYGYRSDAQGNITSYRVYNPWGTGTDNPNTTPAAMSNNIDETYYITA